MVGRNRRTACKRLGLSQEDLAHQVGKSLTYVGQVERGSRNLSLASVEQITGWIGIEPPELFLLDAEGQRAEQLNWEFGSSTRPLGTANSEVAFVVGGSA
ncbi:helix-turn-helix domain-containing protein [Rathayibacter tanaceti]|uniref:Helix-turn-helix domain-containing protein n=1 Tax=Rathayibacter tanaceti TaxID=1671680 RepID=A0AAE6RMY7_9MICO|nr:helix-turn-helix domain-containing protein [Rathayibacter tanaceti]